MSNELERMWKEEVVNKPEELCCILHGGTEKNMKLYCPDSRTSGRDINPGYPEYEGPDRETVAII
jgi:hypothetical protein